MVMPTENISVVFNVGRTSCWEEAPRKAPQVGECSAPSFCSPPGAELWVVVGGSAVFVLLSLCSDTQLSWPDGLTHVGSSECPSSARAPGLSSLSRLGELLCLAQDVSVHHSTVPGWEARAQIPFSGTGGCRPRSPETQQRLLSTSVCF